ncbi:MAG: sulfatase [Nanoarchaeota archaeon]|nr:sulfatase [Nanoarchaeota archaeon]
MKEKPNIIFITLDGLRPKNLSCYGYSRNTSPNIDSLAKQGVLFENFFSSHNVTMKSILSILGGRHVLGQDLGSHYTKEEIKTFFETGGILFPEVLKKNGYKTYCLKKLYGYQKTGFDYYFKQDAQEKSKKWNLIRFLKKIPLLYTLPKFFLHNFYFIPKKIENKMRFNNSGEIATKKAIEIIRQNKKNNFFMWVEYSDTHVPYVSSYKFSEKFKSNKKSPNFFDILKNKKGYNKTDISFLKGCWKSKDTVEDIIAKYDNALSYDDFLVGKIIDTLQEENLLKNTIIFLFADHGESLGEHGLYFTHEGLYDVTFNIPLIISGNLIPRNKRVKTLTQLEDIVPTVLDLAGINHDPSSFDGETLSPLLVGKEKKMRESIFIEESSCGLKRRGIRTEKYKYVESSEKEFSVCTMCGTCHGDIIDLFNLKKDKEETISLAKKDKELLIKMKIELERKIKDMKTMNEKRKIKSFISKIGK